MLFRRRTIIIGSLLALLFLLMGLRLYQLQVVQADYYRQMGENRLRRLRQIPPARGRILDRRGRILAEDRASFELWLRPASYHGRGRRRKLVSNLTPLTVGQLMKIASSGEAERPLMLELASKNLSENSTLVKRLGTLLKEFYPDKKVSELRFTLARGILDSIFTHDIEDSHDLSDPRRMLEQIPVKAVMAIEQLKSLQADESLFRPLEIRGGYARVYPYGKLFGHITGYVGNISPDEYNQLRGRWLEDGTLEEGKWKITKGGRTFFHVLEGSDEMEILKPMQVRRNGQLRHVKGYLSNEIVGRGGVEQWYNDDLRGRHVWRLEKMVRPDPKGPRIFLEAGRPRQAENGMDIQLTIDADFQKKVTEILDDQLRFLSRQPAHQRALNRRRIRKFSGTAVVMNIHSGEVLALVSLPSFDPNTLSTDFSKLLKDRRKPLINRVIAGQYPPGSSLKPLVATAALEEGRITQTTEFDCQGVEHLGNREYVCMNRVSHGPINVIDALKVSCNVFFYHTGKALGGIMLSNWLASFGLGKVTGIDLPGEMDGHLPANAFTGKRWSTGETFHLSIGQGAIDVTPLQIATAYATIANGGSHPLPHLRYDPTDPALTTPISRIRLSAENLQTVYKGMWKVIQWGTYPRGTAYKYARIPGFEYMGKTGSAQKNRVDTHAWLCAVAPYKNPEIVICVLIPFANHGGSSCGTVVKKIVEAYFNLDDSRRHEDDESEDNFEDETDLQGALG